MKLVRLILIVAGAAAIVVTCGAQVVPLTLVGRAVGAVDAVPTAHRAPSPKPLRGIRLAGPTGLRLLVASDPPFLLDLDTATVTPVGGLDVSDRPVLSVLAVGRDAVIWLERRAPATRPVSEIYVLRRGETSATRIATGSGFSVAPSADGGAIWLKGYDDAQTCSLREMALAGNELRSATTINCSVALIDAGGRPLLVEPHTLVDPATGASWPRPRTGFVWALAGRRVLTADDARCALTLSDLHTGRRVSLRYPGTLGCGYQSGMDTPAVQPGGKLITVAFSNPAFAGTQATDLWLLNPATRRLRHLPDMPALVSLKFTSMAWTRDQRLVLLARTAGRDVVAVWQPGEHRIAVRPVQIPSRESGSDSFVVWGRSAQDRR